MSMCVSCVRMQTHISVCAPKNICTFIFSRSLDGLNVYEKASDPNIDVFSKSVCAYIYVCLCVFMYVCVSMYMCENLCR